MINLWGIVAHSADVSEPQSDAPSQSCLPSISCWVTCSQPAPLHVCPTADEQRWQRAWNVLDLSSSLCGRRSVSSPLPLFPPPPPLQTYQLIPRMVWRRWRKEGMKGGRWGVAFFYSWQAIPAADNMLFHPVKCFPFLTPPPFFPSFISFILSSCLFSFFFARFSRGSSPTLSFHFNVWQCILH